MNSAFLSIYYYHYEKGSYVITTDVLICLEFKLSELQVVEKQTWRQFVSTAKYLEQWAFTIVFPAVDKPINMCSRGVDACTRNPLEAEENLTYIAPDWSPIYRVVVLYNQITSNTHWQSNPRQKEVGYQRSNLYNNNG
jgi:hypothetical protein